MSKVPRKIACVHLMRTAGTFINGYLAAELRPTHSIRVSWFEGLERDWTASEMQAFAEQDQPQYVHNHLASWDEELVDTFKSAGFFMFAFTRDVGDQLCSLYSLAIKRKANLDGMTLDTFIQRQLNGEAVCGIDASHWAVPSWHTKLDFCAEFTPEMFRSMVESHLGLPWNAEVAGRSHRNATHNRGFDWYCQNGDIRQETRDSVLHSIHHRRLLAAAGAQ